MEPFGNNPPDGDPDANSVAFDLPLRLPGQYFDKETGLAYDMARDYASDTGRYIQSDPIGLDGGLNTYAYVGAAPLVAVDPEGLEVTLICRPLGSRLGRWASQHFYGRAQKHCFVQVTCPSEGINAVLSLFGESGRADPTRGKKALNSKDDDPSSSANTDKHVIAPKNSECTKCCKYEKEVMSKFNSFPSGWVTYEAMGWNSNSFAEMLVTSPSCRARVPYESIKDTPGFGVPRPR